jgi:hypothetical protein
MQDRLQKALEVEAKVDGIRNKLTNEQAVDVINDMIRLLNSGGHYIADGNDSNFRLSRIAPYIDAEGFYFETEDNE